MKRSLPLCIALFTLAAAPAFARDALGVFAQWAAFRDPQTPRCYAIAMAAPSTMQRDFEPYADVATWPRQGVRGQVHFRLSRRLAGNTKIVLTLGGERFELTGGGGDAWAPDKRMDAAIVALMRNSGEMVIAARDSANRGFSNTYQLGGAATAIDAAAIGCAGVR